MTLGDNLLAAASECLIARHWYLQAGIGAPGKLVFFKLWAYVHICICGQFLATGRHKCTCD